MEGLPSFWSKKESEFTMCLFCKYLYKVMCRKIRNVPLFCTFSLIHPTFWNLKVGKYVIEYLIDQNMQNIVLIDSLRTTWPPKTKIIIPSLGSSHISLQYAYFLFKRRKVLIILRYSNMLKFALNNPSVIKTLKEI